VEVGEVEAGGVGILCSRALAGDDDGGFIFRLKGLALSMAD